MACRSVTDRPSRSSLVTTKPSPSPPPQRAPRPNLGVHDYGRCIRGRYRCCRCRLRDDEGLNAALADLGHGWSTGRSRSGFRPPEALRLVTCDQTGFLWKTVYQDSCGQVSRWVESSFGRLDRRTSNRTPRLGGLGTQGPAMGLPRAQIRSSVFVAPSVY